MKSIGELLKKIIGFFVGMVVFLGVVVGIYSAFFGSIIPPRLGIQIVGETNVFDLNESVKDLQIVFRNADIQKENKNLKIYQITIFNSGGTNITQNDFDINGSWGVKVDEGEIIEVRLIESSSDYIKSNLKPKLANQHFAELEKIILDKGDSFLLEILVLHEKDVTPKIFRYGKIAGIRDDLDEVSEFSAEAPFFVKMFDGGLKVNLFRFAFYFIVTIIVLFVLTLVAATIHAQRQRARQRPQPPQTPNI